MTEIDEKKPKVANWVKVLALMTFALTLWQLLLALYRVLCIFEPKCAIAIFLSGNHD
jgi:hypothetical protein